MLVGPFRIDSFRAQSTYPAQIKTHISFRLLPEKRNGSWTPKRKGPPDADDASTVLTFLSRITHSVQFRTELYALIAQPSALGAAWFII